MLLFFLVHSTLSSFIFTSILFSQSQENEKSNINENTKKHQNHTGECGKSLAWTIQLETFTLYIKGEGEMFNFKNEENFYNPWFSHNYFNINEIIITEGVKSIGDFSFYKCDSLTRIEISSSVNSIGTSSFSYCTNLQSIELPPSVTSIGSFAFLSCINLDNISIPNKINNIGNQILFNCNKLTTIFIEKQIYREQEETLKEGNKAKIIHQSTKTFLINDDQLSNKILKETGTCGSSLTFTLESGLLSIYGQGTMTDYTASSSPWAKSKSSILSINISDGATSIGNYAFYRCLNLQNVTFPNSLETIGEYAFTSCTSIQEILLPGGITHIKDNAFYQCTSLANVTTLSINNPSSGQKVFEGTLVEYVFVPENYRDTTFCKIPYAQSSGSCGNQVNFKIESHVLTITGTGQMKNYDYYHNTDSFYNYYPPWHYYCNMIKAVIISDGVSSIGKSAIRSFTVLQNITIPNSVTTIGSYAFYYCSNLQNITIPDSVTTIGLYAFYKCSSLRNIKIPDGIIIIESDTYSQCSSLQNISIPGSVITIKGSAFQSCSNLQIITIPNSVISIESSVFHSCSSLKSITIPDSVISLGNYIFSYCTLLDNVTYLGKKSPTGGNSLFISTNLNIVFVLDNYEDDKFCGYTIAKSSGQCGPELNFSIESGILFIRGEGPMYNYTSGSPPWWYYYHKIFHTIDISEGVTSIGHYAFNRISTVDDVKIPESVTSIFYYAFESCSNLRNVTILGNLSYIGNYAFSRCPFLESFTYLGVTNPTYGFNLFSGTRVTIIDASENYPYNEFCGIQVGQIKGTCGPNLKFVVDSGILSITGEGPMFNYTSNLLPTWHHHRDKIQTIEFPDKITNISEFAFYQLESIKNITIPPSVTSIQDSAFRYCTNLERIEIPEGVTFIGNYAFESCKNLESITIPNDLTSISSYSFQNCSSLIEILIPEKVTTISNFAFSYCSSLINVTITGNISFINSNAFYRCSNLTSFTYQGETYSSYGSNIFTGTQVRFIYVSDKYTYNTFCGIQVYQLRGPCGPNLTFSIESEVLTITGEGPMFNYTTGNLPSWYYFRSTIQNISISDKATTIGNYAFYQFTNIEHLEIQSSVTVISNSAFQYCYSLQSVTLSGNVTSIGSNAFYQCTMLTLFTYLGETNPSYLSTSFRNTNVSIVYVSDKYTYNNFCGIQVYQLRGPCGPNLTFSIESNVLTIIGEGPMFNYSSSNLPSWYYFRTTIQNITINDGATSIGSYAFFRFTNIEHLEIPSSVTTIFDHAYENCYNLQNVTLSGNVASIGSYAFFQCADLDTFTYLGEPNPTYRSNAFSGTDFSIVYVSDKYKYNNFCGIQVYQLRGPCGPNLTFSIESNVITITGDGPMFNYELNVLSSWHYFCASIKNITINYGATSIGNYAFYHFTNIEHIEIPSSVTIIFGYAFQDCLSLQSIEIPYSVTSIGNYAFESCSDLQKFEIPNEITSISSYTFQFCSKLQEILIPKNVRTIYNYAFSYCSNLQNVTIAGNMSSINGYAFYECRKLNTFTYFGEKYPSYSSNIFVGTEVDVIYVLDKYTYNNFCGIQVYQLRGPCGPNPTFSIESDVLTITGEGPMFSYSSNNLPSWYYFHTTIQNITINDGATSIGNYAFYQFTNIEHLEIPSSVKTILNSAFQSCTNLQSVKISGNLNSINTNAFYQCGKLDSFTYLGETSPSYGSNIFIGTKFEYVYVLPKYTGDVFCDTPVGKTSGSCGPSLNFNIESNSLKINGQGQMKNYTSKYFAPWYFYQEKIQSISLSNETTSIGDYAFNRLMTIETVIIPASVVYVGNYAFSGSINLRKVTYLGKIDPPYGFDVFEGSQTRMIYVPYDYGSYSFCSYQVIYLPEAVTGTCGRTMTFTF